MEPKPRKRSRIQRILDAEDRRQENLKLAELGISGYREVDPLFVLLMRGEITPAEFGCYSPNYRP